MVQFFVVIVMALSAQRAASQPPAPIPVVVELFTSEGCSSCPPADQLLSKLAKEQPVAGVQIIPLGMHVTYWDRLGWKDPASLKQATDRQQAYSRIFGADRVYTPQAVVDGREELVGSDEGGVKRAIAKAARQPHARVTLISVPQDNLPGFAVTVTDVPEAVTEPLELVWLLTEDGLTTEVKRGENGGRTLRHDAAVRNFELSGTRTKESLADLHSRGAFFSEMPREWRRENLRVVVILQGQKSRRIWGAATTSLK